MMKSFTKVWNQPYDNALSIMCSVKSSHPLKLQGGKCKMEVKPVGFPAS